MIYNNTTNKVTNMNERLTELAKQAKVEHCISHTRLDEFAELIVRECADMVDRAISDGGVDGRILKEHFGVKV
jgi:hypothetical protein